MENKELSVINEEQFNKLVSTNEAVNYELSTENSNDLIALVNPMLQSYRKDNSGKSWSLTQGTRLLVAANETNIANERLEEIVKLFNSELVEKKTVEQPLIMMYTPLEESTVADIFLDISNDITTESNSEEAYKIVINDRGAQITAKNAVGALYGLRTIQNLMDVNNGLPYGEIVDYPDVAERRLHVDLARKYISKDWFIQRVREMSYMKLNALQMHFSENHGFRIESEVDPAIVSEEHLTKAEVREIIAEANKYGIKIIPSFDSPGHVDQILRAHPEYGQIDSDGNHYKSGLDVTNPEAVAYIKTLYAEYMDLFEGSTDFHIGGDEYMEFDRPPFTTKYKSVLNNYAKQTLGDGYIWKDVLMAYINDIAKFVHDRGFTPRVWNDGLYYGENEWADPPQKIVMHDYIGVDFWSTMPWNRAIAPLSTFVNKGHDTIYNVHSGFFYYVLRPQKPTDGREQASFDYPNQDRRIYEQWSPGNFPEAKVPDDSPYIKGVSMAIWCDVADVATEDKITEGIANEIRAMATKSWNIQSNSIQTFDEFKANYTKLGNAAGFTKGSILPEVGEFQAGDTLGKITVYFKDQEGIEIKQPKTVYGTLGQTFEVIADDIYGYRLVGEKTITGLYENQTHEHTFVYELFTDTTDLAAEVNNLLNEKVYIPQTYAAYKEAYDRAKTLLETPGIKQLDVDNALKELLAAKKQTVKIDWFALYKEVMNPLTDKSYISGFSQYEQAVENARQKLSDPTLTVEEYQTLL